MSYKNAEILAVGSELLTPSKIDTNSLWLTEQLNALGVEVVKKSVIGDDRARLADAIRLALQRSEIVLITGGIGPTEDDVTRDAVAEALGRGMTFQQELSDAIEERFRRMKRQMVEINKRQAYLIDGAQALPNDRGTAPGQWVEHEGRLVALLPGPPREMKAMFEAQCLPRFEAILPKQVIRTRFYRVACMPESDLDQLIAPVYTRYPNPATTILAALGDIQVHLRARCGAAEEADALLAEVGSQIEALLGDRIYTVSGEPLEFCVGRMLAERGQTVAVAESATGGLLGERLTAAAGASAYFKGGFLAYNDEAKRTLLGVDADLLAQHGAVSEPVAAAMAEGARERMGATYGASITGYAGPEGDRVGEVYVGVASPAGTRVTPLHFYGDRARIRSMAAQWALDLLRRAIA